MSHAIDPTTAILQKLRRRFCFHRRNDQEQDPCSSMHVKLLHFSGICRVMNMPPISKSAAFLSLLRRPFQLSSSARMCCDERNKITGAYNPVVKRDGPSIVRNGYPPFFTRFTFEEQIKAERTQAATIDMGVIPSKWQKRFLVLTQVYESQSDIPHYVANCTMNRMHSRMRLLTIFLPCTFFMAFAFYYRRRKPAIV